MTLNVKSWHGFWFVLLLKIVWNIFLSDRMVQFLEQTITVLTGVECRWWRGAIYFCIIYRYAKFLRFLFCCVCLAKTILMIVFFPVDKIRNIKTKRYDHCYCCFIINRAVPVTLSWPFTYQELNLHACIG